MKREARGIELALCNLVTEPYKGVFRAAITPPAIKRIWCGDGHLETQCWETCISSWLRIRGPYNERVVEQE